MIPYSDPGHKYKGMDLDGDLISSLTEELVNDKKSRDGIPHSLFPLSSKDLPSYNFVMKGEADFKGRHIYQIAFEPRKKETCVTLGRTMIMNASTSPGKVRPGSMPPSSNRFGSKRTWHFKSLGECGCFLARTCDRRASL